MIQTICPFKGIGAGIATACAYLCAEVAKMVNAGDSQSPGEIRFAGSNPALGTTIVAECPTFHSGEEWVRYNDSDTVT